MVSRRHFMVSLAALPVARVLAQDPVQDADATPQFSTGVSVVNVLATVRDANGKIVPDLTKEDFTLEENGRAQTIRYFSQQTDLPLTLGLLIDTSGSVYNVLGQEVKAARTFLAQVLREDKDRAFIIRFDSVIELVQDLTSSRDELDRGLFSLMASSRPRFSPQHAAPVHYQLAQFPFPGGGGVGGYPGGGYPGGGYPGGGYPGGGYPGGGYPGGGYPGGGYPGGGYPGGGYPGGGGSYPGTGYPGTGYPGTGGRRGRRYPGSGGSTTGPSSTGGGYPGGGYPGSGGRPSFGGTCLNDAVFLGADEVLKPEQGRKAMILITDGLDGGSKESLASAIEAAQRADTLVYSIRFAGQDFVRAPEVGVEVLQRISSETGATFFDTARGQPLESIFSSIDEELRNQYSLGFTPPEDGTGYRNLKITVKRPGVTVHARDGYYRT